VFSSGFKIRSHGKMIDCEYWSGSRLFEKVIYDQSLKTGSGLDMCLMIYVLFLNQSPIIKCLMNVLWKIGKWKLKWFWKYCGKCNICSLGATAPFATMFAKVRYHNGGKRHFYWVKGLLLHIFMTYAKSVDPDQTA